MNQRLKIGGLQAEEKLDEFFTEAILHINVIILDAG